MRIEIGDISNYTKIPQLVNIMKKPFILNKDKKGEFILFSAICPHLHGTVDKISKNKFECPHHGWTYDPENGESINSLPAKLQSFSVTKQGDKLFVDLPKDEEKSLQNQIKNSSIGPKISLISNACMLIEWKGKKLLTDPWIEGPAIFGSWIQYPPNDIKVKQLPKIDAIWISHEHSDHLHPNTLAKFDKNIPVYVPEIQDDRLGKIIKKIGFKDVISMPSFQSFKIADTIEATSFKSASTWNDGILFLQTGDFKILNFNDAGINWNVKKKVDDVDLICSSFSQSASSYPSNWTHLNESTKDEIMDNRNQGVLKMLKKMAELFNAKYLLPIASFNALWHPKHMKYEKMKKRNSLFDVIDFFKDEKISVLDLIPGESWDGQNKEISRRENREKFFDNDFRYKYLKNIFKNSNPDEFIPSKFDINHDDLKKYFLSFSNAELTKYVGDMKLCFTAFDSKRSLVTLISFNDGKINYEELKEPVESELVISCPGAMVQEIIQNDLSWDEIMYWSTFHRNPDKYNLAFWRLLHAPWRAKINEKEDFFLKPLSKISIATLVEKGGDKITEILEENGMYCTGCPPSVGENLQDGCNIHGVSNEKMKIMTSEIQKIIKSKGV
jgi:CMP-N-acetylneuraminate monooxygenase